MRPKPTRSCGPLLAGTRRGVPAWDEFLAAIGVAVELIQRHPAGGSRVPKVKPRFPVRRLILRRFPYSVVFMELENEIRILAIAHHRRRPGYWSRRLPR
ncbi:MAG: type II toxin-antitoxin system RelE/ParE family toxin [Thermodesulfobacteriota bacterium]